MCGIAGIYNFNKKSVLEEEINILTDAVFHRGPDGKGIWFNDDKALALGHRRLSILDLSEKGKQPMSYNKGRYRITYNGEIYNFLEVKSELEKKSYLFISDSDTEVILAAYQEWGEKMLHKFNGMWAFAIYDSLEKKLFLSRDRFGIKPLYYYKGKDKFIFSSEVQAIHKILGDKHPLNEKVIKDISSGSFLNHGTNETYLENVFSLPGGYNLLLDQKGKTNIKEWYVLNKIDVPEKFEDQAKKLKELLYDSCTLRLRSDVLIGTCLSGGIDSGGITAIINSFEPEKDSRFSKYTHRGFCASFPDTPLDERKSAELLAEKLGSKLDIVEILPPSKEDLEMAMEQCDGPMHALAFFPIWNLYKYIKNQGITVTLDGQGPDEMLGGYRPILEALESAIEFKNSRWFWDIYKTYSAQGETPQFSSKWYARKVLIVVIFKKIIIYITNIFSWLGFSKMKNDLSKLLGENKKNINFSKKSTGFNDLLDESLFEQFFQSPLPGILNQYDRCSMAHGVECRMPYMDYRIVEFVFSLPPESKVGGGYTKRVLREALKEILPDETRLNKLKLGFNAPIVDWFRGPLKEFMIEQMDTQEFVNSKYFDGEKMKNDFEIFLRNPKPSWDDAWKFWPPVHLTWWMNHNNIK
ncbi:MAG TPA: asparagine synthase (glutamine-hydrolyzing) [Candidatus Moranbacteria bacterium]|nr:asparagine synthase (glutamine-hydrolyzing) [Candidatus Moranbacteria bacterium]